MTQSQPWPPLIQSPLPAWMKWRDAMLTLFMWILLGYILERQVSLVESTLQGRAIFAEFLRLLAPYVRLAVILILLLLGAAALTQRRRRRGFQLPEPQPLALADEARRAGLDEAAVTAARGLRVAVVQVNDAAGFRIQSKSDDDRRV
jgi:hypothetical protein